MDIAVVGAGLTGLSAAHDLSANGHSVTVYEARDYAGGLSAGFRDDDWDWPLDRFYHHWFASDEHIIGLIDDLGASDRLWFEWPTTSLLYEGITYPLDSPVPALDFVSHPSIHRAARVLQFTPLSFLDRLRVGLTAFYLTVTSDWRKLERTTADAWLRRTVGERAYQVWWKPLLLSKFGQANYDQVNMAWLWARAYKRTARLGYFIGGFQGLIDLAVDSVRALGGRVILSSPVTGISQTESGRLDVQLAVGSREHDLVLATCSPRQLATLVPALPPGYRDSLLGLRSMSAIALILALERPLTHGHYWINIPAGEGIPFMGLIEHTNFVPREHYGGDHLVYCADYLEEEDPVNDYTKGQLLDLYLPGIASVNPSFSASWIRKSWMVVEPYAQPVPLLNQSERLPSAKTPLDGLWMANMSLVYPWDRGSNYAVEMGRRVAREMVS